MTGDGAAEVASEANGWKVGIKEGKYGVELTGGQDRVQIEDKQVTVSRNKKAIVTISMKSQNPTAAESIKWLLSTGSQVLVGPKENYEEIKSYEDYVAKKSPITAIAMTKVTVKDNDFAQLANFPEINSVTLDSVPIGDVGLSHLAKLPKLTSLFLNASQVTDRGLASLLECRNLSLLHVANSHLSAECLKTIGLLAGLKSLTLTEIPVTDSSLAELEKLSNLTDLGLVGCNQLTDACGSTLGRLSKLQVLRLNATLLGDETIRKLAESKSLSSLSLYATGITDASVPLLARIKSLRHLGAQQTALTAAGFKQLTNALPHCAITTDHGVFKPTVPVPTTPAAVPDPNRQFAEWLKSFDPPFQFEVTLANGSIQSVPVESPLPTVPFGVHLLYLRGPHFEQTIDAFLDELTKRVKGQRITGLFLASETLTSAGVARLTQMPAFLQLSTIGITSPLVDDTVFKSLASLPNLQFVNLICPKITGEGLGTLQQMKNLSMLGADRLTVEGFAELQRVPLEYLQINRIKFNEPVLAALSKLKLTALDTNNVGIDDTILARIAEMTPLEVLAFYHDPITDAGLMELKKLINLRLTGTKVTAAGVADLQQALPKCKIESDVSTADPNRQFAEWLKSIPQITFDVTLPDGGPYRVGPE